MDISIDAGDGLQQRCAKFSRGSAGVPGSKEDMSDIMARGMAAMAKRKLDDRDRKKGKDFKF
jgi:splicing factor 3B subunit 2